MRMNKPVFSVLLEISAVAMKLTRNFAARNRTANKLGRVDMMTPRHQKASSPLVLFCRKAATSSAIVAANNIIVPMQEITVIES